MKNNYTPGEGCECSARCSCECGCDADWTPREVYELLEQRDRLAEELDALKRSILDLSHPNMKLLLEERNEARTSSVCTHGITTASAQGWALMHEAAIEQRDRLAEALDEFVTKYAPIRSEVLHKLTKKQNAPRRRKSVA